MSWGGAHPHSLPHAIVHIDGDAFFASCEQVMHPEYRNKPVVTGKERGIAASMSYEAKACGVTRGMMLNEIKKVCPRAIILPSDYETYSLFSERMFAIMRRFTPMVEEYSIDEAFADLTGLRRPLHMSYAQIASSMKVALDKELGFTVSVGLASTKSLSKIASKWKKPNGFTYISNKQIPDFLKELPVEKIWGVGPNTTNYMQKLGIHTAYQFIRWPYELIKKHFTKPHQEIWYELNGQLVYPISTETKKSYASISKTKTFTPPSSDPHFIYAQLIKNLENACIKARRYNLVAHSLIVFLKKQDFSSQGFEIKLTRASVYPSELTEVVQPVFRQLFQPQAPYRATGVILSRLQPESSTQLSLFDPPVKLEKLEKIYSAIDDIAKRYGKHTVHLAASTTANKFAHHLGARGDIPIRKQNRLKGESKRKHLNIPFLFQKLT